VLIHPGIQVNQVQNNWEPQQDAAQLVEQEIVLQQPVIPAPQEEVAENEIEVVHTHLLGEENNLLYHEIPDDALMDDNEIQEALNEQPMKWQQNEVVQVDNIQLGMVRIIDNIHQPQFPFQKSSFLHDNLSKRLASQKDVTNFATDPNSEKILVEMPKSWVDFFDYLLHFPHHFDWTSKLLNAGIAPCLQQQGDNSTLLVPRSCPMNHIPCGKLCEAPTLQISKEDFNQNLETPKKRAKLSKAKSPIVDTEVRRSSRVKEKTNGFKQNQCQVKNCPGCSINPPTLSMENLKKIGAEFCQFDPDTLEKQLTKKKNKPTPICKKKNRTSEVGPVSKEDAVEAVSNEEKSYAAKTSKDDEKINKGRRKPSKGDGDD
jgi:hypothetical protein